MNFQTVELPTNRKFGLFFTGVFVIFSVTFFIKNAAIFSIIFAVLSGLTLGVTLIKPDYLLPFNKLWMRFGFLLGKIVSPIVLGIIYFLIFTPVAICMRLAGRDELQLKNAVRTSHWKHRSPIGPEPSSFKNQF